MALFLLFLLSVILYRLPYALRALLPSKFLTIGLILLLASFKAHSQVLSCSNLFNENYERYVTFDKIGEMSGTHGGKLAVLKKHPGKPWESRQRINIDLTPNFQSNIAQGNPAFIISLLGENKAKFWGFRLIDRDTITLPNAKELQGSVKEFNSKISSNDQKIQVGFYEVNGEATTKLYTKNYLKSKSLPITIWNYFCSR